MTPQEMTTLTLRVAELKAENERLREALEHIENYYGDGHRITELARAALGETE